MFGEDSFRVRANVRTGTDGASGSVQVDAPNGMTSSRELRGESCREVVAALALVAALAIDSGAEPPQQCAPPKTEPAARGPEPVPPVNDPAPSSLDEAAGRIRFEKDEPVPSKPVSRLVGSWNMGAHALFMGGIAPSLMPGAALFVGYEPETGRVLDARLRASIDYAPTSSNESAGGEARFGWAAARLEVCPAAVWLGGGSLLGCATVGGGRSSVEAMSDAGRKTSNAWVDVGAAGHFKADVARWLVFDAQVALVAPLTRYTFVYEDRTDDVYRTPALAGLFGLGLALRFH